MWFFQSGWGKQTLFLVLHDYQVILSPTSLRVDYSHACTNQYSAEYSVGALCLYTEFSLCEDRSQGLNVSRGSGLLLMGAGLRCPGGPGWTPPRVQSAAGPVSAPSKGENGAV